MKRTGLCGAVLLATCSSLGMTAHAQDLASGPAPQSAGEDVVVVTASGFEQKITDAPASISVITAEELKQRPYMTLIDAVRDLEGVDVGETADKTGQRTISLRGMGSDYTLVLIDGKRQNNHGEKKINGQVSDKVFFFPIISNVLFLIAARKKTKMKMEIVCMINCGVVNSLP